MSDEELAALKNDDDAVLFLLQKYKNLVRAKARYYFLAGADKDDIIQEGMIGLYKSIRDFKAGKNISFHSFADMCITRQIITAVKAAARKKHIPLNSYISLNIPAGEDDAHLIKERLIINTELSPEDIVIYNESYARLNEDLSVILTALEKNALNLYLNGKSYIQIAEALRKNKKSVDNALRRAKDKIHQYYKDLKKSYMQEF